jgi:hypothetical protein
MQLERERQYREWVRLGMTVEEAPVKKQPEVIPEVWAMEYFGRPDGAVCMDAVRLACGGSRRED